MIKNAQIQLIEKILTWGGIFIAYFTFGFHDFPDWWQKTNDMEASFSSMILLEHTIYIVFALGVGYFISRFFKLQRKVEFLSDVLVVHHMIGLHRRAHPKPIINYTDIKYMNKAFLEELEGERNLVNTSLQDNFKEITLNDVPPKSSKEYIKRLLDYVYMNEKVTKQRSE